VSTYSIGGPSGLTIGLPAIAMTGTTTLNIRHGSAYTTTFNQSGSISVPTIQILTASTGTTTYNTGNNSITASTSLSFGANNSGSTFTGNFGSSTLSAGSINSTSYNTGTSNINLQTSTWTVTGSWTFGSNHTVSEGTSLVTFSGTAAHTITSSGKKFYDVTINNTASAGTTFADAADLHTLTVSATNTQAVSWTGTTMTASGDIVIDGSGTTNIGNSITMNGASGTLHFGSTVGTITGTSCTITMNGTTNMTIDDDKGYAVKILVLGANAVVTNTGSAISTYAYNTSPLVFTNGGSLTFTTRASFCLTADGAIVSILAGTPTFVNNASGALRFEFGGVNCDMTFPALTVTGTSAGGIIFVDYSNYTGCTLTLTGNFSNTGGTTAIYQANTSGITFSTGNFSMTLGAFNIGLNSATSTGTFNFGSSAIICTSFNSSSYNAAAATINLNTSTWNCNGSWSNGSLHTLAYDTSLVTIGNTGTITSAGKSFYGLTLNPGAGKTVTLSGALTCVDDFIITTGSLTSGNFDIAVGADFTIAGAGTINLGTSTVFVLKLTVKRFLSRV